MDTKMKEYMQLYHMTVDGFQSRTMLITQAEEGRAHVAWRAPPFPNYEKTHYVGFVNYNDSWGLPD